MFGNKKNSGQRKVSIDKRVFSKSIPPATVNYQQRTYKGIPILSDDDVEIAKEFVEENEK